MGLGFWGLSSMSLHAIRPPAEAACYSVKISGWRHCWGRHALPRPTVGVSCDEEKNVEKTLKT